MALNLYRRHIADCKHASKGAAYIKCSCPIWCDGVLNGRRYRHSLGLRHWQRAVRKVAALETPGARLPKAIPEAIAAFHDATVDLASSTNAKYRRVLQYLAQMTASRGLHEIDQITVEDIDALRSYRTIGAVTWIKHLEILRQFFQFCVIRKWIDENPAAGVVRPKNIKQNEVEPYSREDVTKILMACGTARSTSAR